MVWNRIPVVVQIEERVKRCTDYNALIASQNWYKGMMTYKTHPTSIILCKARIPILNPFHQTTFLFSSYYRLHVASGERIVCATSVESQWLAARLARPIADPCAPQNSPERVQKFRRDLAKPRAEKKDDALACILRPYDSNN